MVRDGLFISAVTLSEMEYGICRSKFHELNRVALLDFLCLIDVMSYDSKAAIEYGYIRADLYDRRLTIGSMDMLIAAHAKSLDMVLVTNTNINDKPR